MRVKEKCCRAVRVRVIHRGKKEIILMTYNFDPDRWYENELFALKGRYKSGKINDQEYTEALDDLDRRHEEMWKRLDGSFRIPQGGN